MTGPFQVNVKALAMGFHSPTVAKGVVSFRLNWERARSCAVSSYLAILSSNAFGTGGKVVVANRSSV